MNRTDFDLHRLHCYRISYAAALCGCLMLSAACSGEDDATSITPQGGVPIEFSTEVEDAQTRGAEFTKDNLAEIGVFAYFTNGEFNTSNSVPNFMYNQQVTKQADGTSWDYSPKQYWPNNDTDKLSFFAYAPYVNSGNPTFSQKTDGGYPTLTYTVPSAEAAQVDLLAATPLLNQTFQETSGNIQFAMKHALCKVGFSIRSEEAITVTALTVNNAPATGTLEFTDGGFSWGNYSDSQTFTATLTPNGTSVTANSNAQTLATFFLLPDQASATFSITYTQHGDNKTISKSNLTFPSTWEQGKSVNYQLNVKKDGTVTATVAQEWTPGTDGSMTGKEKGIGSPEEWLEFTKLWNANGLPNKADGTTPDYSLYEKYGWYETEGAKSVFTIKLTSSFVLTGVDAGELYTPVGTDSYPLTLPIDGQGWKISIDLQNSSQLIEGTYSGIVGYTKSDIRNLRVVTIPSNNAANGCSIQSSGATYAGVLAGRVDGDILNSSVELVKTTVVNTNTAATGAMYLGGLVGYCGGNIQNCAVYDGPDTATSEVSFSNASAGSGIGGLAGGVANSKTVDNCYVRLSKLSKQAGDTPAAGWLVGSKPGVVFTTCHYMSGNTATGCTPDDSSAGIASFTDFTGLCTKLNTEVAKHTEWAPWKEITGTGSVDQVVLNLNRE